MNTPPAQGEPLVVRDPLIICYRCGYELHGLEVHSGLTRCPECGLEQSADRNLRPPPRPLPKRTTMTALIAAPWLLVAPFVLGGEGAAIGAAGIATAVSFFVGVGTAGRQARGTAETDGPRLVAALKIWVGITVGASLILAVLVGARS